MFAGPSFGQLLFSTDTLQFARPFARDALFQHLYRPTVRLVNHQWTNLQIISNHCKAVLVSWEGSTVSMEWIIDNEALLYLKSRDSCKIHKIHQVILHHKNCNSTALALSSTWSKQRFPANSSQGFSRWPQMFTAQLQPAWEGKTSFTVNFREGYPYRSKLSSITSSVVKRQRRAWELSFLLQ